MVESKENVVYVEKERQIEKHERDRERKSEWAREPKCKGMYDLEVQCYAFSIRSTVWE